MTFIPRELSNILLCMSKLANSWFTFVYGPSAATLANRSYVKHVLLWLHHDALCESTLSLKEKNSQVFRSDHKTLRFESGVIFAVIASCIMHLSNVGSVLQLQRKWFIILLTGRNKIEKVINNVDIQFFWLYICLGETFLRIWHLYFYIQISSRKYDLDVFFDVIDRQRSQLCDVVS